MLNKSLFENVLQIRTEGMDLIAERGIAAHYSGRAVSRSVRPGISSGRNSKGKTIFMNNTDFALRVCYSIITGPLFNTISTLL